MEVEVIHFSLNNFFEYMDGHSRSRCIYEGEEVYNAGHVILCGVTEKQDHYIRIYALCLQTSALQSPPHKIEGQFKIENNNAIVEKIVCSCKAGNSGRCKHISGTLILCTRTSLDKLEIISQTEIECTWSNQKAATKDLYKPVPIEQMPCFSGNQLKNAGPKINENEETLKQIRENMISCLPNSAFALHRKGRLAMPISETAGCVDEEDESNFKQSNLNLILDVAAESILMMELTSLELGLTCEGCKLFYNNICDDDPTDLAMITKNNKNNWFNARKFRLTASRIYEIFTYCGKDWVSKSNKYFYANEFNNIYTRHGISTEPVARNAFIEATGFHVIEVGLIISGSNQWLGVSPDGIILSNEGTPQALLEIKCPYAGRSNVLGNVLPTLKYLEFRNNVYCLKAKHKYYAQIQAGMAVLNLKKCYFAIYCSHDESLVVIDVDYNYEFSKKMLFTVKKKYFLNMLHNVCDKGGTIK